jgi:hypothetical protein
MEFFRVTIETRQPGAIGSFEHRAFDVIASSRDAAASTAAHAAHLDAWETRFPVSIEARMVDRIDVMTLHYVICALWSSNDESDESGGNPMDNNYSVSDLSHEAWAQVRSDCADFIASNGQTIDALPDSYGAHPDCGDDFPKYAAAGHDFWLTRNGHGTGFWDRGLDEVGDRLADAAEVYGGIDPYIGDDGQIYF